MYVCISVSGWRPPSCTHTHTHTINQPPPFPFPISSNPHNPHHTTTGHTVETDHKGHLRVKPDTEFQGNKYFVPKEGIPDKAAFIGGCVFFGAWGFG